MRNKIKRFGFICLESEVLSGKERGEHTFVLLNTFQKIDVNEGQKYEVQHPVKVVREDVTCFFTTKILPIE